jgi:hypothetical protein
MKLPKKIILLYLAAGVAVGHLSVLFIPKAAEATDYIFGSNQTDGFFIRGRVTEGPTPTPIFRIDTNTGQISFGSVPAARVSGGQGAFGSAIGGGNYSFPANLTIPNGNVGIGTTSPGEKLDVNGAIYALSTAIKLTYDSDLQRNALLFWGDGAVSTRNNGSIYINPNGTGNTLITNGNVGIGVTNPQSKLSVGNAGSSNFAVYVDTGSYYGVYGYGTGAGVYGYSTTNTGVQGDGSYYGVLGYSSNGKGVYGSSIFGYDFYGAGPKSYFAGNVGIGTTAPSQKLDVAGHAVFDSNTSRPITLGETGSIRLQGDPGGWAMGLLVKGSSGTDRGGFGSYGSADTLIYHWIGSAFNNPTMVIQNAGNVGIGTTAPTNKLHIYGATDSASRVKIETTGADSAVLELKSQSNSSYIFTNSSGDLRMYPNTQSGLTVRGSNGYVGIGTTAPVAKLEVNGTTIARSRITSSLASNEGGALGLQNPSKTDTVDWVFYNMKENTYGMPSNSGGIQFWRYSTSYGNGPAVTFLDNGNVGIGVTNPQSKLSVGSAGSSNYAVYVNTGSYYGFYGYGTGTGVYGYSSSVNGIGVLGQSDNGQGVYGYSSNDKGVYGSSTYGYDFYGGGPKSYFVKVGINTEPNSSDNLHIYETDANERSLRMGSGGAFSGAIRSIFFVPNLASGGYNWLSAAGDSGLFWSASGAGTGNFVIAPWSSSDAGIRITSSGYVGIGVQSPGYQLDVWSTSVRGYGAYINRASHSSLKDRYTDVSVLDKIAKLNIKEWQYKDEVAKKNKDKGRHLYPFADDFYKIFNLGDSEYQIRAEDVAGVALKGVQELNSFLNLKSISDLEIKNLNFEFKLTHKKDNSFITRIGAFAEVIVAKIKAGLIEAKKIVVDQLFIGETDVGKKLQELSDKIDKQQETINAQQKEIEGLKEEIKKLKNN